MREGEYGDRFYVVVEGELDVSCEQGIYPPVSTGDVFGEIALLQDVPCTATVTARDECLLYALDRESFLGIAKETTFGTPVAATAFIPVKTMTPKDNLTLLPDAGYSLSPEDHATLMIADDDQPLVSVAAAAVSYSEGGGIARFYGTARLHKSGSIYEEVWTRLIQPEKDRDPEKKGFGVLIRVDRAEDLGGDPLNLEA